MLYLYYSGGYWYWVYIMLICISLIKKLKLKFRRLTSVLLISASNSSRYYNISIAYQ